MGKVSSLKAEVEEVKDLVEIFGVLKDVATNRYYSMIGQQEDLSNFFTEFDVFFNMLGSLDSSSPLIRNRNPASIIIAVTAEPSFMSILNSKVCNTALEEYKKYPNSKVVCVGWRGEDKCKQLGMEIEQTYKYIESVGRYQAALKIRDFIMKQVLSGKAGRVVCVSVFAQNFSMLKPKLVTLLPAEDMIKKGSTGDGKRSTVGTGRDFIKESSVDAIMQVIADVWVTTRIVQILAETKLAEFAAQAQQLDSSIDGLSVERKALNIQFKKALRANLNKAIREVIVASKIKK